MGSKLGIPNLNTISFQVSTQVPLIKENITTNWKLEDTGHDVIIMYCIV